MSTHGNVRQCPGRGTDTTEKNFQEAILGLYVCKLYAFDDRVARWHTQFLLSE